ncbi:SLATT domain-containing protein [Alteromonas sp. a30]|uniref:SLATT domain-containing protein n=1 Tax=Alteromonas sp. a30 TaxID=2730917 RepID=UPI0022811AEA|nr:SLATT domain-containing protein [Alteromonas sp. a30]MCY7294042.1 SLATT domain-containing protein [Alteromonas sp. a30]
MKSDSNEKGQEKVSIGVPLYTQGGFDKQLNYSLWSTSRARFIASRRLNEKNVRSYKSIALLSAYMILFSLFDYFFLSHLESYNGNYILFTNVMLSLLILIFSQLESSASYGVRAVRLHQCALDINSLYKKLRRLKNKYENREKDADFFDALESLDKDYDAILRASDNHEVLDNELFKSQYPKYEDHKLGRIEVLWIKIKKYLIDKFFYHMVTNVPMALFAYIIFESYFRYNYILYNSVENESSLWLIISSWVG